MGDDQVADADLVPIPRQVGGRPRWPRPGSTAAGSTRWRGWLTEISVRGGGNQLLVQVTPNERHECSAGRMNPADRQPRGNLGNSRVVARQNIELQLGCGFDGEVGVLPSKPCRLRLAAAVDSEQNQRGGPLLSCVEWFAFAVMVVSPGIKKGPGQGLVTARLAAGLSCNNGRNSSDNELHNHIITTHSCCQDGIKLLI